MSQRFCTHCGTALADSARFCAECGTPRDGVRPGAAATGGRAWLASLLSGAAIIAALAYLIGSRTARRPGDPVAPAPLVIAASDISALSADERVDRLVRRVMGLSERGALDSVAFFAPMAVDALAALEPLTPHRRYDLGLVLFLSGDAPAARSQVESLLAAQPTHLLGLALGERIATAEGDAATARGHARRFSAALRAERAKGRPEYREHSREIDDAVARDTGGRTGPPAGGG